MLSSRQRLCLVCCLCVQFQRQFSFDSGASHSFVSRAFVERAELHPQGLAQQHSIVLPGSKSNSTAFVPDVEITIQGAIFSASPIDLVRSDIDVILGMDLLFLFKAPV